MRLLPGRVAPSKNLLDDVNVQLLSKQHVELEKLREEGRDLRRLKEDNVKTLADVLAAAWLKPSDGVRGKTFFDDPVWGNTCIDEELASLFFQPLVQRLNHVKQLSFAYLTFPNATHSRLAHSLGTCRNAEASLTTIFRNNVLYTSAGRRRIELDPQQRKDVTIKAKAAALLHDVGHPPFGHALDKLIGYLDPSTPHYHPDKYYSQEYLNRFLGRFLPASVRREEVSQILGPDRVNLSGWDVLIADLVDSWIDADRMDYLVRDAHMTGLSMGVTSAEAIIERMCPFQVEDQIFLTFDYSCLPYVDDFLVAREKMYVVCYEHPSKLAAERIFTKLVGSLLRGYGAGVDKVVLLTDEQILALLAVAALGSRETSNLLATLLENVEFDVVLEVGLESGNAQVRHWTENRDSTRMGHWAYIESPERWETEIATAAGIGEDDRWRILVSVPDQRTGVPSESNAQILSKDGGGYRVTPLFEFDPRLRDRLKDAHRPRGKIRVFADSRMTLNQKRDIQEASGRILATG